MRHWLGFVVAVSLGALAGCGGDDDDNGGPDGGGGPTPQITRVSWTPGSGCRTAVAGPYTINVMVTDGDTNADQLTFSGSVASCTGAINAATATINCPNAAAYQGSVTVTDPQNNTDTQTFSISPCAAGMAP